MKGALRSLPLEQVWIAKLLRAVSADSGVPRWPLGSVHRRASGVAGPHGGLDPGSGTIEESCFTRRGVGGRSLKGRAAGRTLPDSAAASPQCSGGGVSHSTPLPKRLHRGESTNRSGRV